MPAIQINIPSLQLLIMNNLKALNLEDQPVVIELSPKLSISVFPSNDVQESTFSRSLSTQPVVLQQNIFQEESSNGSFVLNTSVTSSNLNNSTLQQFSSQNNSSMAAQAIASQQETNQYQTLSINQTIWSPQILPQTQQEFMLTQSQIVQQQQQHQIQLEIQRLQDISTATFLGVTQPTVGNQGTNHQQNIGTGQAIFQSQQPYEIIPSQSHQQHIVAPGIGNVGPVTIHQQYMGQPTYQTAIQNLGSQDIQLNQVVAPNQHMIIGSQTNNGNVPCQDPYKKHSSDLIFNQYDHAVMTSLMNQQQQQQQFNIVGGNQLLPQASLASYYNRIITQPQQKGISHHISPQMQGPSSVGSLTLQEIQNAAAAQAEENIHNMIVANPQIHQQYEQQQIQIFNKLKQPTPMYGNPQQMMHQSNDPINFHHYDHNTHLAHLYVNRQINRYMHNPIYKTKGHKYTNQSSFRGNTQSPDLLFSGNLSVLRPPPGFEHVIPKNVVLPPQNQIQQLMVEAVQSSINQQIQQNVAIQGMAIQQQQQHAATNQAVQFQMLQQHQQQQQQQQHQLQQLQPQINNGYMGYNAQQQQQQANHQVYINSLFSPHNQVYTSYFGEQIRTKQSEIDEQLRKTTQQLDHKLMENLELQERWSDDQDFQNQEEIMNSVGQNNKTNCVEKATSNLQLQQQLPVLMIPSTTYEASSLIGSSSSSTCSKEEQQLLSEGGRAGRGTEVGHLNACDEENSKTFKMHSNISAHNSFKESKESKERIELFKKLRNQLNKIKNELFSQTDQSINPKLSPFRLDPSKYLEKILNLMTIINEVESNTNIAEQKGEHERSKQQLLKETAERQRLFGTLTQVTIQYHEMENNYQQLQKESNQSRDQQMKEREQLDVIIKMSNDQIRQLSEIKDQQQVQINDLVQQLDAEQKKQHMQKSGVGREQDKVRQIIQEYGKKVTDYQVENNDLREYIKKRSQDDQQKRSDEKRSFDNELSKMKDLNDQLKKSSELQVKERDTDILILQENIQSLDPEFFKTSTLERVLRQCPDCKRKEAKILDAESRVKDLTEYIKKKSEKTVVASGGGIVTENIYSKYEDEISVLKASNLELSNSLDIYKQQESIGKQETKQIVSQKLVEKVYALFDKTVMTLSSECRSLMSDIATQYKILPPLTNTTTQNKKVMNLEEVKVQLQEPLITQSNNAPHIQDRTVTDIFYDILVLIKQSADDNKDPQDEKSKNDKEKVLMEKMAFGINMNHQYKEIMKEGRNERKLCHSVIVEVEKLMYKLNSMLITEQMNLEEEQKTPEQSSTQLSSVNSSGSDRQLNQRLDINFRQRELFGKILETYLELPHKLKPIFDRLKKNEQMINKCYKGDPSLLYDISADIIGQYKQRCDEMGEQLRDLDQSQNECLKLIERHNENNELQKLKIIELKEKIVQINSAYNALQKHLYSSGKGSTNSSQTLQKQQISPKNRVAQDQQLRQQLHEPTTVQVQNKGLRQGGITPSNSSSNSSSSSDFNSLTHTNITIAMPNNSHQNNIKQ